MASPAPIRILLEAEITFDVGGETTHAPMVHASVQGRATKLILDTGSSDHLLTIDLADAVALPRSPGESGTDSVGAEVASWRVGEVEVEIGGRPLALTGVLAIVAPAPFAAWGIGGILSPQRLHPTAYAVLDLVARRFTLAEASEGAMASWLEQRHPTLRRVSLERPEAGEGELLVRAGIEPHDPVVTLLDTGGKRTEFAAAAVPGLRGGEEQRSGRGVSGGDAIGFAVANQVLRAGDVTLDVPSLLVRPDLGEAQGLVGMDLLAGTVLAVRADRAQPVLWLVPRDGRAAGGPQDAAAAPASLVDPAPAAAGSSTGG